MLFVRTFATVLMHDNDKNTDNNNEKTNVPQKYSTIMCILSSRVYIYSKWFDLIKMSELVATGRPSTYNDICT